jgi:peptidylprolyl isomerase
MTDSPKTKPEIEFYEGEEPTELVIIDIEEGTGVEATPGATVDVHYLGVEFESGAEFDSSWGRGQSISFPLSGLIKGWQEGIPGMRVGGRRELIIPPSLGYGPSGSPPKIPGNATLEFVIDLHGVS